MRNLNIVTSEGKKNELSKLLYTIDEASKILSMSIKSVRRLLERGLLKANPALRIKLITRESIEAFAKM